jgi:hypothetical protein
MVIQVIVAVFLILHGLVHLLWFVVPWRITEVDGLPYSTKIFNERFDIGDRGIKFFGLLWLLPTILFIISGLVLFFSIPWWFPLTLWASSISCVLCILAWPIARWGALIDVIIIAVLLYGSYYEQNFLPFG